VRAVAGRDPEAARVTATVSFGMPSKAPEVWMADVAKARAALGPRQMLIVSVVATPAEGEGERELVADFANLAAMAREAGAHVVEANLSCPNVCTAEGEIFHDARLSGKVARAMRKAAGRTPVLLKIGYLPERRQLASVLKAVSGQASGVVMVNGVPRTVLDRTGRAAFGAGRKVAGILGRGIHELCVASVREAADIRDRQALDLEIVGVGGVATAADAARFFDAGAAAVMMGSAPMYDPLLAVRLKAAHPDW
jgi:dihydroorotate dehydrogenase